MGEKTISNNIKWLRSQKEMTLKMLAEKSGLTKGYLSKIEHAQKIPSYLALQKIAMALEINMSSLLSEEAGIDKDLKYYVSREDKRIISKELHPFLESPFEPLAQKKSGKNMESFILYPTAEITKMVSHAGEKLMYIIEGSIEFFYGEERHLLHQGDHIYLDAEIPHGSKRVGDADAKIMVVLYFYKRH